MTTKKVLPKKRGAKGYFTGSRLEFLNQYSAEYISLRGKNRANFWLTLFEHWWKTYPWRLGDDEEPPTGDTEKMKALSRVGTEHDLKSSIEKKLRGRITTWFGYRATVHNSRHESGVWSQILKHTHEKANPKPRCRSVHQQFMLENPETVNAAFVELYGEATGMTRMQKMNCRNELASTLVKTTYVHLVTELTERAKETHEQELKEWGLELDDISEAEDIQSARDSLFSAVHPLLKLIGRYSGCYVTLLASGVSTKEEGKAYFSTVHYFPEDKPRRKNWTEYDEEAFKSGVAHPFVKYIHWMEGSEGEEPAVAKQPPDATSMAAPPPQPASTIRTHQPAGTSRQSTHVTDRAQGKKRRIASESSEEEDVDMNIEDNSSSGSSVDPDEFPAKRLRSSTIVTRGFKATTSLRTLTTTTIISKNGRSPSTDADAEVLVKTTNTSNVGETIVDSTPSAPTSPPPSLSGTGAGSVRQSSPGIDVPSIRAAPLRVRQVGSAPPDAETEPYEPSDSRLDGEPTIPDFLVGKYDIYSYLVSVDEPGFKALLDNYITFELADRSGFRGNLPTARRPKAVGWWSSRARPNKLPPYDSLSALGSTIVQWWIFIQPDWRGDELKCGEISRDEGPSEASQDEECWERLYQPGINGLLNIVILVYWWARILKERGESADADYRWLVEDITWVLSQLARVASEGFSP